MAVRTLARQLDRETVDVAWGVHDIVAENMAGAARVHLAECGRDAGDFVLLHGRRRTAARLLRRAKDRRAVHHLPAGRRRGLRLRLADRPRAPIARAPPTSGPKPGRWPTWNGEFAALEAQAREPWSWYRTASAPSRSCATPTAASSARPSICRSGYPRAPMTRKAARLRPRGPYWSRPSRQAYEQKFGRTPPNVPVELVNLRVAAEAPPRVVFRA